MESELRIGLYICHCGLNIAGVISPEALSVQGQGLPEVAVCRHHLYTCSEAGQAEILKDIKHYNLDRVVIAACSPKLHEVTFRRLLSEAGLNPYLVEIVNIREHCAWVHGGEPDAAQHKALELIRMGLAKARLAVPLQDRQVPMTRHALVIGGGPAGLRAALDVANAGFPVTLVEREPILGGMANRLHRTFPRGESALALINPLMAAVTLHPGIRVLTQSEVVEVSGHLGEFAVTVRETLPLVGEACDRCGRCAEVCPVTVPDTAGARFGSHPAIYLPAPHAFPGRFVVDLEHCDRCGECVAACPQEAIRLAAGEREHHLTVGSIVVATGFTPFDTAGSRYENWADHPGVVTTVDLERLLAPAGPTQGKLGRADIPEEPRDVAFLLCVGSREEEGNRYCSRVCCPTALKQALELKAHLPEARIRIYYRDIRTNKKDWEALYTEAREAGVLFLRGRVEEEGNRYCSRVCCPTALKQALELKAHLPEARIRIYYRDIRTNKKDWEALYTEAREAGVLFLRGRVEEVKAIPEGGLLIRAFSETFQVPTEDRVDLAVLAVGMVPGNGAALREVLKLPVGPDGFFLEAHPKLRPLETVLDGIFLAGACQGPKDLAESFTQGSGAAAKVLALLAHETITLDGLVAQVDPEICVGCGECAAACPFQAMVMVGEEKKQKAQVVTAACKGCGVCAGACPTGAVIPAGFTDDMILAQIDEALAEAPEQKILAFCCNWCSYAGADFAGVSRLAYPPQVRIIRTLCAGRIHPKFILHAFELGAGQVLVSGCHPPGDCHYVSGNLQAQGRVEKLRPKLAKKGIDPSRLRLAWVSATEGRAFQRVIAEMAAALEPEEPIKQASSQGK